MVIFVVVVVVFVAKDTPLHQCVECKQYCLSYHMALMLGEQTRSATVTTAAPELLLLLPLQLLLLSWKLLLQCGSAESVLLLHSFDTYTVSRN